MDMTEITSVVNRIAILTDLRHQTDLDMGGRNTSYLATQM
jgi:hypothetical protein